MVNDKEINVYTKRSSSPLCFKQIKENHYMAAVSDIKCIELPIVYICKLFRTNKLTRDTFNNVRDIIITIKYDSNNCLGSITVSDTEAQMYTYNNSKYFYISESEAYNHINHSEDDVNSVFVEVLTVYDSTDKKMTCILGAITANGFIAKMLYLIDNAKRMFAWFLITLFLLVFIIVLCHSFRGEALNVLNLFLTNYILSDSTRDVDTQQQPKQEEESKITDEF